MKLRDLVPKRPRERRLAISAGVLIGCWVLVSVVLEPLWDRMRDSQALLAGQQEKLGAISRLIEQAPEVEAQYRQVAPLLQGAEQPADAAQESFLNTLEQLSRDAGVTLNLKPQPMKRDAKAQRFEVELDVEGPQAQVLGFMDTLLGMPSLISIERVRMSVVPARTDLVRALIVIQNVAIR